MTTYDELISRQRAEVTDGLYAAARRLRWSSDRLADERQRQLRELLAWSSERSPFWRSRLSDCSIATFTEDELPSLPILTKADLMSNFDAAVTDPSLTSTRVRDHVDRLESDAYLDDRYRVIATSGSTGARVMFVYGWQEWITFVLIATRWRGRSGEPLNASVGTLFASNTLHLSGALHAFSKDFSGSGSMTVTHLPATLPLPEIVAGLNAAQSTVILGYPSAVYLLAIEAIAGRLNIRPTWIATCGEQCTVAIRDMARSAWGIEIYDYYGCSEGLYAFPCEVGDGMHLPDDVVIVEPVDRDGMRVPPGQPADKILLTNLYNRTQPLIRYEITDAVTLVDAPCECGCAHRRINDIRGRMDSFFLYEGGAAVHRIGMEEVLMADPAVVEVHVKQTRRGATVNLVTSGACNLERIRSGLVKLMALSGVANPEVTIRQVDSLTRLWSGKLQRFEPMSEIQV